MDALDKVAVTKSAWPPADGAFGGEGLIITGTVKADAKGWPQIHPVFPGLLRFVATDPIPVKKIADIPAKDGVIDSKFLESLDGLKGYLIVNLEGPNLKTMIHWAVPARAAGKPYKIFPPKGLVEGIDAAPSIAWYGPVELSTEFLTDALLDPKDGMMRDVAQRPAGGGKIPVTDKTWPAAALFGFLHGSYKPRLRAKGPASGVDDDAAHLPMPRLASVAKGSNDIRLNISFGWPTRDGTVPDFPTMAEVETIPAQLFLQQMAPTLCDLETDPTKRHPVAKLILDDRNDIQAWKADVTATLATMGFAPVSGGAHPLTHKVREFQIAAHEGFAAKHRAGAPLGSRAPEDLVCTANSGPYGGPLSGRLNQATRAAISLWSAAHLRNPLLILPFAKTDLEKAGIPKAGAQPAGGDLWRADDDPDTTHRMFAVDVASLTQEGATIDRTQFSQIGRYVDQRLTGPQGIDPAEGKYTATPGAEMLPKTMLGISDADLMQPLPDATAEDERSRRESSFRVIRAVSEIESWASLDGINAYDAGMLSIGAFHWATKGSDDAPDLQTELGGLAAYLSLIDDEKGGNSADVFKLNGLAFPLYAPRGTATLRTTAARRSAALLHITTLSMLDDRGKPRNGISADYHDYLRSWRCFHRCVAFCRSNESFMQAMWPATLRRLYELMTEIRFAEVDKNDKRFKTPPTLQQLFTSELCVAKILRWHVNQPNDVLDASDVVEGVRRPADALIEAYRDAAAAKPKDEHAWQRELSNALNTAAKTHNPGILNDFKTLEEASWISLPVDPWDDAEIAVKSGNSPYHLSPALRRLKRGGKTFHLSSDFV